MLVPQLVDDEPAVRRWARGHDLNRPTWRQVWTHAWPWLAVTGMLAYASCWWGLAMPLLALGVIGMLASRRPRRVRR